MFAHLQYLDELSRQKMPATGVARECVCVCGGGEVIVDKSIL